MFSSLDFKCKILIWTQTFPIEFSHSLTSLKSSEMQSSECESSLSRIKVVFPYYHQWFHELPLTSMESFYCTKVSLYWAEQSFLFKVRFTKGFFEEPGKVLLWHPSFGSFILKSAVFFADEPDVPALHLKGSVTFSFPLRTRVRRAWLSSCVLILTIKEDTL